MRTKTLLGCTTVLHELSREAEPAVWKSQGESPKQGGSKDEASILASKWHQWHFGIHFGIQDWVYGIIKPFGICSTLRVRHLQSKACDTYSGRRVWKLFKEKRIRMTVGADRDRSRTVRQAASTVWYSRHCLRKAVWPPWGTQNSGSVCLSNLHSAQCKLGSQCLIQWPVFLCLSS